VLVLNAGAEIMEIGRLIQRNTEFFYNRRIYEPAKAIVYDLLLNERPAITDRAALQDARDSLESMLYDFVKDTRKDLSDEQARALAAKCDMSVVSTEYQKALRQSIKNVVTGNIVRMLLIQVQYLKRELVVAMTAIDTLVDANRFNLQVFAIIPAILTGVVLNRVVRSVLLAATSLPRGKRAATRRGLYASLREHLWDMERLLTLSGTRSQGGEGDRGALNDAERGRLLSLLHRLHTQLIVNHQRFDETLLRRLQSDLRDLARPGLSVQQQQAILTRVLREKFAREGAFIVI